MTQNITPIDPNADREPSPEVRFLNPETQAQTSETQISPKTPLTLQQKAERRIARLFEDYSESMTHYQEMLKSNKMGWETFFSDMERNTKNADKLSPEEQIVALSFFGIGLAIKRSKDRKLWEREFVRAIGERTKLQERKKTESNTLVRHKLDQAQAANTSEVTRAIVAQDNLNISDVIWQQACIKMITSQENHPQQKQLVALFWQNLENLYSLRYPGESPSRPDYTEGQDEAHALKYGILGPLTTKYVLDAMGVSSTLPKSRDDAIHKVDLISEATSKSGKKYAAVIQIKTSQLGLGDIRCEEINHLVPENLPSLYARQEARARNRLFRFAQDLSRKTKMQAVPLWAEIKGEKDSPDIDDITGRPNQAFINRHLGGQFGQTIKKVLNIP